MESDISVWSDISFHLYLKEHMPHSVFRLCKNTLSMIISSVIGAMCKSLHVNVPIICIKHEGYFVPLQFTMKQQKTFPNEAA